MLLALVSILLGLLVTDVLVRDRRARRRRRGLRPRPRRRPDAVRSTDASFVGSTIGGAPVLPILVGLVALVCAFMRKWRIAAFAVFVLARRVGHLPRDDARRPARAARRAAARGSARRRELPVGPHRGLDRRLRGPRAAAHLAVHRARGARIVLWTPRSCCRSFVALSRMYRGMHHPLDVAGGVVVGIGALARPALRLPRGRAAAERTRARRAAGARRRGRRWHEGRGHRPRGQDARRRAARAAPRARGGGRRRTRSGARCRRPRRRREQVAARARGGRRARLRLGRRRHRAALRRRAGRRRTPTSPSLPAGTANLFATNLGIPCDIQRGGRDRPARRRAGARRRPLQRRALRGDGGRRLRRRDDPRRRRPQGADRPRRLPVERRRATCAPRPSTREIEVDGDGVVRRPGDVHPARQPRRRSSAASTSSRTPRRTTACSSSASSRRRARAQWARTLAADGGRRPEPVAVRARDEGDEPVKVKLDRKVRYELDGGDRTQGQVVQGRRRAPARCTCLRAARGARRRRRHGSARAHGAGAGARGAAPGRAASRAPPQFEWLARAGLVARGVIYGDHRRAGAQARVRLAAARRPTSRARCRRSRRQPLGKVLLDRCSRSGSPATRSGGSCARDRPRPGGQRRHEGADRGLASGIAYAMLCVTAVQILVGAGDGGSRQPGQGHRRRARLARRAAARGPRRAGPASASASSRRYKGLKRKFLEESKTEQMSERDRSGVHRRSASSATSPAAVVFGLIGYFLINAAIDYDPEKAVGPRRRAGASSRTRPTGRSCSASSRPG